MKRITLQPSFIPAKLVPELLVSDISASLRFWRDLCGFAVVYDRLDEGFAYLDRDGAQVMLEERGRGRNWITAELEVPLGRGTNFQVSVKTLAPILEALESVEWPLFLAPEQKWYRTGGVEVGVHQFLVQDPDGYLVRFAASLGQRIVGGAIRNIASQEKEGVDLQVRPISPAERDQLLLLYGHLHAADEALPDASVICSVWNELMADPRHTLFGGYKDGELVSSCALTVIPNLTRGCRPYGVLENVVTHGAHRGKGYGKAVLREALGSAWSAGCYKVMLFTGRKDRATVRFYESAGFDGQEKLAFIAKPGR